MSNVIICQYLVVLIFPPKSVANKGALNAAIPQMTTRVDFQSELLPIDSYGQNSKCYTKSQQTYRLI